MKCLAIDVRNAMVRSDLSDTATSFVPSVPNTARSFSTKTLLRNGTASKDGANGSTARDFPLLFGCSEKSDRTGRTFSFQSPNQARRKILKHEPIDTSGVPGKTRTCDP